MAGTKTVMGMRDRYFEGLYSIFQKDKNAVFITADNGAPTLDQFITDFPNQYYQVGIAEAQMIGMAAGMAFEGKRPYTYAILPFVSLRVYEQIKLDVCAMNLPVVNIGVGAGYAYDIMGPTHHTMEDISIMRALPNLRIYSPCDGPTAAALADIIHADNSPGYLRMDRAGIPDLHSANTDFSQGLVDVRQGSDVLIISMGVMVHESLKVADALAKQGIRAGVVDLFRLKPVNEKLLLDLISKSERVVTYEEHRLTGGLGSIVAELLVDNEVQKPLLRVGQDDRFVFDLGGRQVIWEKYGLDAVSVTGRVKEWVGSKQPVA